MRSYTFPSSCYRNFISFLDSEIMLCFIVICMQCIYVGGAKLCEMVFCTNMCNEDFVAFLKEKGLTEPDCKKLSGM